MKWAALTVVAAVLLVINPHEAAAQVAPGQPSITSVSPRDTELRIAWTAPASDGGSTITLYDARYIRSDAPDKDDPNNWFESTAWYTGDGALEYTITGLTNDVPYDVQMRAVHSLEGPWSATRVGTPAVQNRDAEFAAATDMRTAPEDLAIGRTVGAAVTATDPDRDALTYTITSGEQRFSIDSRTGQLRLKRPLNYESQTSYNVIIEVRQEHVRGHVAVDGRRAERRAGRHHQRRRRLGARHVEAQDAPATRWCRLFRRARGRRLG